MDEPSHLAAGLQVTASGRRSAGLDGLETVAEMGDFASRAEGSWFQILPDYTTPLVRNPVLTTLTAVGLGTIVMAVIGVLLGRVISVTEKH